MELKGKKILVTGADGFIGSHLVERLLEEGAGATDKLVDTNGISNTILNGIRPVSD